MDYPVAQGVDGQLRYPEEVLPGEVAMALLVEAREAGVQPLDLLLGEAGLVGDLIDLLLLQLQRGAGVAHLKEAGGMTVRRHFGGERKRKRVKRTERT